MNEEQNDEKRDEITESIPTIRTMQTDAQIYIKKKNLSPLEIAAKTYAANPPRLGIRQPYTRTIFLVLGVFVLIVASIAGWWFFLRVPTVTQLPSQPKPPVAVVRAEEEVELAFSPTNLRQFLDALERERETARSVGSLVYFPVAVSNGETKRYIGAQEFFEAFEIKPPQSFLDTIQPIFYLFAYRGNERGSLAFVFRARSFERIFSSLLFWERTLPRNLHYFIPQNITPDALPRTFSDKIIKNHDARVLSGPSGTSVLAYALFDKSFVVLATSEEALAAVLERMIAVPPQ